MAAYSDVLQVKKKKKRITLHDEYTVFKTNN